MQVPVELLEKWKILRSPSDAEKIWEKSNTSIQTVRSALRTGECDDDLFKIIADFYKEKANFIKQYIV